MENTTRLHPDDMALLADLIANRLTQSKAKPEPLLNLKELSETIGVPYGTLAKKKLPCRRMGRHGRKMYVASEVMQALSVK
jgi:hypothetical protein